MNIRVVDESGKVLGTGRDLQTLREQLAGTVQASISKAARGGGEQQGLTAWTFGELPREQELGTGAVTIKAYPALVDRGDCVDLCLLDSEYRARLATTDGVELETPDDKLTACLLEAAWADQVAFEEPELLDWLFSQRRAMQVAEVPRGW